jgi:hypothetical protein
MRREWIKSSLEEARRIPKPNSREKMIIVSVKARKMVKYNFTFPAMPKYKQVTQNNRVVKQRVWPKYFDRERLEEYFQFPTPGAALRHIKDNNIKSMLVRWHKDYQYLSIYTHVAFGKMILQGMSAMKHMEAGEKIEIYSEKKQEYALFLSHTAIASACTMIAPTFTEDYGATNHLKEFWKLLYNSSLISKAYWNIYAKKRFFGNLRGHPNI